MVESYDFCRKDEEFCCFNGRLGRSCSSRCMEGQGSELEGGSGIITARGTSDGLVIRLDGRVEPVSLRGALSEFLEARKGFLSGQEVALEWVGRKPAEEFVDEVSGVLEKDFRVKVKASRLRSSITTAVAEEAEEPVRASSKARPDSKTPSNRSLSLFDGIEALRTPSKEKVEGVPERVPAFDAGLLDEANARAICATLRSGQKIESEHSVIVFGDVNSGAEVVAGGDIVVLGTLRGVAHAGAFEETGGGRVIVALNLQPTQLRIGTVISRGSGEGGRKGAEVAHVEGKMIMVEPYTPKGSWFRTRG